MILRPYMAKQASLHEASYVYLTVERAVLGELGERIQAWAMENVGPAWHSLFLANPSNYPVQGWRDPADPVYMLKAIAKIPHTPLLKATKSGAHMIELARDAFHARNLWAHYSQDQQMLSIKGDIRGLVLFAEAAGLDSAVPAKEALAQLVKVTAGAIPAPGIPVSAPAPASVPVASDPPKRPRIGSAWSDELPAGQIDLNLKLRDVLDPQTGASLRGKWPSAELAEEAIERWFALKPATSRLRLDERDGATVGFIEGFPYLFGYLGVEPESPPEQYRGFLGRATYLLKDKALISQGSGKALAIEPAQLEELLKVFTAEGIGEGEAFRLSNYNDLVHLSDDGPLRVLTARIAA